MIMIMIMIAIMILSFQRCLFRELNLEKNQLDSAQGKLLPAEAFVEAQGSFDLYETIPLLAPAFLKPALEGFGSSRFAIQSFDLLPRAPKLSNEEVAPIVLELG